MRANPFPHSLPQDPFFRHNKQAALEKTCRLLLLKEASMDHLCNHLIGEPVEVYHGSLNSNLIRVGELLRPAVRANAASIILIHNHPSGDPTPSPEDLSVTKAIAEAGKILDIEVLDHIIIGGGGRFISMKSRGLGFS